MYGDNRKQGGFGGGFDRGSQSPVKVGEEIDVKIEAVGEKGDGICKKKGFVLFVPNTKEGDEVRIRVTKVLRKVGFADVVGPAQGKPEADTPAPAKVEKKPEDEEVPQGDESEDFGEEVPAEEEPAAEEPAAEEPAPEPAEEMEEPPEPELPEDEDQMDEPPAPEEEEKQ